VCLTSLTPRSLALVVAVGVVAADQLTKLWVVATLPGDPIVLIDGVLTLRYVQNPGAAFGILPGAGSLLALAAVAAAVIITLVVRHLERPLETVAMGLVLGGAVGNLIDRIFRGPGLLDGKVVDFVDFDFFPAFNVADASITIGAGLALVAAFVFHGSEE
jgi:signal peptidase II